MIVEKTLIVDSEEKFRKVIGENDFDYYSLNRIVLSEEDFQKALLRYEKSKKIPRQYPKKISYTTKFIPKSYPCLLLFVLIVSLF